MPRQRLLPRLRPRVADDPAVADGARAENFLRKVGSFFRSHVQRVRREDLHGRLGDDFDRRGSRTGNLRVTDQGVLHRLEHQLLVDVIPPFLQPSRRLLPILHSRPLLLVRLRRSLLRPRHRGAHDEQRLDHRLGIVLVNDVGEAVERVAAPLTRGVLLAPLGPRRIRIRIGVGALVLAPTIRALILARHVPRVVSVRERLVVIRIVVVI